MDNLGKILQAQWCLVSFLVMSSGELSWQQHLGGYWKPDCWCWCFPNPKYCIVNADRCGPSRFVVIQTENIRFNCGLILIWRKPHTTWRRLILHLIVGNGEMLELVYTAHLCPNIYSRVFLVLSWCYIQISNKELI